MTFTESLPTVNGKPLSALELTDLYMCYESVFYSTGIGQHEGTNSESTRSTFIAVDTASGAMYHATLPKTLDNVLPAEYQAALQRVPNDYIYPLLRSDCAELAVESLPADSSMLYVKGPKFQTYSMREDTALLAEDFDHELQVYNRLRADPHPNIGVCEGYLVTPASPGHARRVLALLLRRYPITIKDYVTAIKSGKVDKALPTFDKGVFMSQLRSAVKHMHSLGYAHNDINPHNIMLDEQGAAILIDLGSARCFGETLTEGGTPGFNEGFEAVSAAANDEIGLLATEAWLDAEPGEAKIELST